MRKIKRGKIIVPAGVVPWPHEIRVAEILALAGHVVKFLPTSGARTADITLDGVEYEIKSPLTDNPQKIIRNIKRALKQSQNVIIDSQRIKGLRDDKLCRLLANRAKDQKTLKRLLLITKRGLVIDIMPLT